MLHSVSIEVYAEGVDDQDDAAALAKNDASGVIDWDGTKCVNCLLCTAGCAYGGIVYNERAGSVVKCDLCGGDPACATACPTGWPSSIGW